MQGVERKSLVKAIRKDNLQASTSVRPLRTFRIVAQKAHQRGADWIRLLLLQPMTGAIKQSVFLHSRASARSHHIDGARSHVHCPVTFSTKESRLHIYSAPGEEPKLGNQ